MIKEKKNKRFKNKKKFRTFLLIFLLIIIVFGVPSAYAIYNSGLKTKGVGKLLLPEEIVVSDVTFNSESNCGYEIYSSEFDEKSVTVNVDLPSLDCTAVYDVTITNYSSNHMKIKKIMNEYYNNENIMFEFSVKEGDVILSEDTVNATLTIKYRDNVKILPSDTRYSSIIEFSWEEYNGEVPVAKITYSEENWTNKDVVAMISFNQTEVKILNNEGNEYVFKDNGEFTFEFENVFGIKGKQTTSVTWIDKKSPLAFAPSVTDIAITSLSMHGETTDSSGSGISKYYFSLDDGKTWNASPNKDYSFTDLSLDTNYIFRMKAVDKAGNETISYPVMAKIDSEYNKINLPIFLNIKDKEHFDFKNFPYGITYSSPKLENETIDVYLRKPKIISKDENKFSAFLPIINATNYEWMQATISIQSDSNWTDDITSSLSDINIKNKESFIINLDIESKINVDTIDKGIIKLSYLISGERKHLNINLNFVPWNYVIP